MIRKLATLCLALSTPAWLWAFDFQLAPQRIAPDTYLLYGKLENFTPQNLGNISNTAFIVTSAGVVVIDTGSSKAYGEAQQAAIQAITNQPVTMVLNTHHHPDHCFGNQAYDPQIVHALPDTIRGIKQQGPSFLDNLYRMVGDPMRGTEVHPPGKTLEPGTQRFGDHELEFIAFDGHTGADLVIFDKTTGVLFAGDLVFHQRPLATPHAHIGKWLGALDPLEQIPFTLLVSGHGNVASDAAPIQTTRRYLQWLHQTFAAASLKGKHMNEVMHSPAPQEFEAMPMFREELARSVVHLYGKYEEQTLNVIHTQE